MMSLNKKGKDMENEKELDRELGKKLRRSRLDRHIARKDHLFETDPETAVMRYRYDKRTMDILGPDEWKRRFGSDD